MIVKEFVGDGMPKRKPLPLTQFVRKRYWLGKTITEPPTSGDSSIDDQKYRQLLHKVHQGTLSPEHAMALANQEEQSHY